MDEDQEAVVEESIGSHAELWSGSSCRWSAGWHADAELSDNDDPQGRSQRAVLPAESNLPPLESRYFPDRLHAFVWRNWNAVEPAKLAKILGTSVENVQALAESMGLPPAAAVGPEMKTRGYITLHPAQLASVALRSVDGACGDDARAIGRSSSATSGSNLGPKPKCEPLHYRAPDEAARRRAAEIRRMVEEVFGDEIRRPAEPRFAFVRQLSSPLPSLSRPKPADDRDAALRFIYSYFALYGDPLANPKLDPYPDGLLQRLSALGSQRRVAARRAARHGAGRNDVSRVRRRSPTTVGQSQGHRGSGRKNTASTCIST